MEMTKQKIFCDFETLSQNNTSQVYLWGCLKNEQFYYDISIETFFEFLSSKNVSSKDKIYFHNLSFDGSFILNYLSLLGYEHSDKVNSKTTKKFNISMDENSSIYSLIITLKNKTIQIYDSLKILPISVKNLGLALNFEKLEIDHENAKVYKSKESIDKLTLDYLRRDCEIIQRYILEFSTNINLKTTIASSVYNDFKAFYGPSFTKDFGSSYSRKISPLDASLWHELKRGYFGGFVALRPGIKNLDMKNINGHSYDVNSMYPSIMLNYKMPYAKPSRHSLPGYELKYYKIFFRKISQKYEYLPPNFLNFNNLTSFESFIASGENFYGYFWENEFNVLKQFYNMEYSIIDTYYFKTKYVFKSYIEKVSKEKIEAKNEIDRFLAKLKQNSLYGKFGQNILRKSKILLRDNENKLPGKRYGNLVEVMVENETKGLSYIPIASYITSISRTILFSAIIQNKDSFLYCDTDSIYLDAPARGIELHESKYGAWKFEKHFSRAKFLKPKCYMLLTPGGLVTKVAGLPEESQKLLNFDNFIPGTSFENFKLKKSLIKGGYALEKSRYKL